VTVRYAYPKLDNCGLAHELFTWARCEVWCARTGAIPIAANWWRPRIGPWIRRERDKRLYARFFLDKRAIRGIAKRKALWFGHVKIFATDDIGAPPHLHELAGYGPMLRRHLLAMTRREYVPAPSTAPFIAVHVRLGDFHPFNGVRLLRGECNMRTPIGWFVHLVTRLREQTGADLPIRLYSDGWDDELKPLLTLPGVTRSTGAVITDLLEMTEASAIIGSGSGLSILASLLGNVPRVSHPGQRPAFVLEDKDSEIEVATCGDVPQSFIDRISQRLTKQTLAA